MSDKKPIQQGATSAAASASEELPSSPTRKVDKSKPSLSDAETFLKPFQGTPDVEKKGAADGPKGDIEDKGGTPLPIPAQSLNAPSVLVAGSSTWSPEMGIEKFCFSHCREWRLSEFVAPKWSMSQVVAPDTFQKYSVPFPCE